MCYNDAKWRLSVNSGATPGTGDNHEMSGKARGLLGAAIFILLVAAISWFWLARQADEDYASIAVTTDKRAYVARETVRVSIRNAGERSVDVYCRATCALGNFPTEVERSTDGQWRYFAGFCPSVEPLFGSGIVDGDYIRHRLSAHDSFELELSNSDRLRLDQVATLRVLYYLGGEKRPVYSNEFSVSPTTSKQ
jgi:hypothetical protein